MIILGVVLFVLFQSLVGGLAKKGVPNEKKSVDCYKQFLTNHYIPDYAKGLKNTNLEVFYNDHQYKCGETVTTLISKQAPTLKLDLTNKCKNVTIIKFDPESVVLAPYVLWLVHNVPTEILKQGFNNGGTALDKLQGKSGGDVKATYAVPIEPTGGSGIRKVIDIFFVYCQCRYIIDLKPLELPDRYQFNVKGYMKNHGMGCPMSGLFHNYSLTEITLPTVVKGVPQESITLPVTLPDTNLPVNA